MRGQMKLTYKYTICHLLFFINNCDVIFFAEDAEKK